MRIGRDQGAQHECEVRAQKEQRALESRCRTVGEGRVNREVKLLALSARKWHMFC